MDCSGVARINGTTPAPDSTNVGVCNAGKGTLFVGTTGLIYIRMGVTVPCANSDWVLLRQTNPVYGRLFTATDSATILPNVTTIVPFASPNSTSSNMTFTTNALVATYAGIYRIHAWYRVTMPDNSGVSLTGRIQIGGISVISGYTSHVVPPGFSGRSQSIHCHFLGAVAAAQGITLIFNHNLPGGMVISDAGIEAELI